MSRPTDGVRRKFRSFVAGIVDEGTDLGDRASSFHSHAGITLLLDPDDEMLVRAMLRRLGQDPRHGGSTSRVARRKILDLAAEVVAGGSSVDAALDQFDDWLRQPPRPTRVFVPIDVAIEKRVKVGRCIVHPRTSGGPSNGLPPKVSKDFPEDVLIETVVEARDTEGALLTAQLPIDEALGCLSLPRSPVRRQASGVTIVEGSAGPARRLTSRPMLVVWPSDVKEGELVRPWLRLSRALEAEPGQRGDLARRLAAASRWHHRAVEATTPDESTAHLFASLDTAFVQGNRDIGIQLARFVKAAISIEGVADAGKWIRELYEARGNSVHAGHPVLVDEDVDLLHAVTHHLLRQAVATLDDGAPTLDELLGRLGIR